MPQPCLRTVLAIALALLLLPALSSCGKSDAQSASGIEVALGESVVLDAADAGPLRLKAMAHDTWLETWHTPNYGSHLHVQFTDDSKTRVDLYHGHGDSCIWTGTYITSQALRYSVTGELQARQNVIRSAGALSRHLHVTGRPGFIARYVGPQNDPGHAGEVGGCEAEQNENCHLVNAGEFAGDFWIGNTSRDQYTGWFMGMAWAYDLVDDADMRRRIETDVTLVLDRLIADDWWIIDVDGEKTTKAPSVLPPMQMTWSLIGYHITGQERFLDVFNNWAAEENRLTLVFNNISIMNRYAQHYGLNLAHENFLNLLRLSHAYPEAHTFLLELFNNQTHRWVDLQHNPWYTAVLMAEGDLQDPALRQAHRDQIIEDLTDFPAAPKERFGMTPPQDVEIDPLSQILYDLQQQVPLLKDIMGTVNVQAKEAYPVRQQCSSGFMFQRNMWAMDCSVKEDVPEYVNSGHDYLAAYWLASAYGVLDETD